ncbi:hypothetical protein BG006_005124 [Podila minutissima]|uniref:Ras-GEF domain-containing protein n=1 Tax=Podila minutissima TaxID=64525 RepID=A0A9P5SPU3_9FUNG|nr:hypothetical protein BG006_005124 [Podila minutissima]
MDMDREMSKYASLLQSAKAEHDLGDLKSAYSTYMKAHAVVTRILETQTVFRDQDSLKSVPDNYTQLFAHAQEILRRTKGIVEQAKTNQKKKPALASASSTPPSASETLLPMGATSKSTAKSLARLELNSSPSSMSQRTVKTVSTLTDKRTKRNIPMIPISPLMKQYLTHNYALTQVTQRFEQAKHDSSSNGSPSHSSSRDLAHLRRLIEDVRIQRAKLDLVNSQIQSVTSATITMWDPDVIAKQLTIIDAQLFKEVAIPRDLVRPDRKLSSAQFCIDFENYVAHSVAHVLLQEWNTLRQPAPASSSSTSKNGPPNAVAHMIRIAQILLHVYRNFNGFIAIMRALTSPEIKRMHKLWSGVNSKTKDTFRRLVNISHDQGHLRGYMDTLLQKLEAFQDVGKDAIVAIPWMRYHQDEVKSIINSYLTGHESKDGSSDVVLSAPGARKLSAITAILLQCRTNEPSAIDRFDLQERTAQATTKNREAVTVDGLRTPLTPIWDLASLDSGDPTLHHWLLSRPFLNKQQLIDESLEIEPLFNGEELPCFETPLDGDDDHSSELSVSLSGENQEGLHQDDSFEHFIALEHDLEPLPSSPSQSGKDKQPLISRSPVSEFEINTIMNELLDDDSVEDGLFDNDSAGSANETTSPSNDRLDRLRGSPGRTSDVLEFLGIDPNEYSGSDNDDNGGDVRIDSVSKGKGKALEQEENEEIDSLIARVKGLVHESRNHNEKLRHETLRTLDSFTEDFQESTEAGLLRKFEPMQQGLEEDGLQFHDDPIPSPQVVASATSFGASLESLRAQLGNLDNDSLETPTAMDKNKDDLATSTLKSADLPGENAHIDQLTNLNGRPDTQSTSPSSSHALLQFQASPPPTSNPFAPFIIHKLADHDSGSLGTSPPQSIGSIGKGRRRKIQTDRSRQSPENSASPPGDKTPLACSPPRSLLSTSTIDLSKEDMTAIEARANISLAGFLNKASTSPPSVLDESALARDHGLVNEKDDGSIKVSAGVVSTKDESGPLDIKRPDAATITLHELDKTMTTTTTSVTTHSSTDGEKHEPSTLNDKSEDSLSKSTLDTISGDPILDSEAKDVMEVPAVDGDRDSKEAQSHHDESGLSPDMNKDDSRDGMLSAGEGPAEGKSPRARHRRRIVAGGVISLPTPVKNLASMGSTSSLSGAFKAGEGLEEARLEGSGGEGKGLPEMQAPEGRIQTDDSEPTTAGEHVLRKETLETTAMDSIDRS